MNLKSMLGTLHLWLGLIIGMLFFVICLSGAIYTWEPEFSHHLYQKGVQPRDQGPVSLSQLKATLDREFPEGDFRTATYRGKDQAMEVLLYVPGTYYYAFLNPYDGSLLHLQDMKKGWLNHLKNFHRNLLLGPVGSKIVHWVTLLSLVMLITGLVLWWPVNQAGRKQRFSIKWGASPKRLNYDLHNVLGFYATWIVIFSVATGIFWGFETVRNTLASISGETAEAYKKPLSQESPLPLYPEPFPLMDSLMAAYRQDFPGKEIRVSHPHGKEEPIQIAVMAPAHLVSSVDHFYADRYTGQILEGRFNPGRQEAASIYTQIEALVYDLHYGSLLGFPGRLLACLASLICASLPITGLLVWLGKRKKRAS